MTRQKKIKGHYSSISAHAGLGERSVASDLFSLDEGEMFETRTSLAKRLKDVA